MEQFRIITNGTKYRAQNRAFLFFWLDCWYESGHGFRKPILYETITEAEIGIEKFKESTAKWKPANETAK